MHQRLKFQGHACGRWSPLLRPSRLHSVEHKQQWQGHVKTLMVCSTLLHWQSTSQRWRAYLALHCQVILMTPLLIHKHKTPPILFVRVFIPVTSEQRETVNVYMRVADSISQPCFCVTHRTTRAVFMFGIWHMLACQRLYVSHYDQREVELVLSRLVPPSDSTPSSSVSSLSVCPKAQAVSPFVIEVEIAAPLCHGKAPPINVKNADHDLTRRVNTRKRLGM